MPNLKSKQPLQILNRATVTLLKNFLGFKKDTTSPFVERIETRKYLHIIRFQGDIDMSTIPGIENMIIAARKNRGVMGRNLLLDLKKVNHVDSATVAALIVMLADLANQKQKLALVNIPVQLEKMFSILACRDLFMIYKSEETAIKELNT